MLLQLNVQQDTVKNGACERRNGEDRKASALDPIRARMHYRFWMVGVYSVHSAMFHILYAVHNANDRIRSVVILAQDLICVPDVLPMTPVPVDQRIYLRLIVC